MTPALLKLSKDAVIGCIDPGKVQGWAIFDPHANDGNWSMGDSADGFLNSLGPHLSKGTLCFLGIEAPGFLPRAVDYNGLFTSRVGETDYGQSRPWSSSAGQSSLWSALPLAPKLLGDLRELAHEESTGHLKFTELENKSTQLILFEAFVTTAPPGHEKPEVPQFFLGASEHVRDSAAAIVRLLQQLDSGAIVSAIRSDASLSLYGSALLATGWSADALLAKTPAVVVRTFKPAS